MEFSFKVKTTEKPLLSDSDWSPAFSCWFFRSRVCRVGSVIRWRRSTQSLHGPSPSSSACSLPPSLNVQATLQQQLSSCPSWLPWYQKHSQHRLYLLFADVPTDVSYHKVTENRRSFTLEPLTDFYYDTSKQEVLKCNRKKAIEASLWVKLMTCFPNPVPVHQLEPSVRDDPLHPQRLLRLHAASGHSTQCHCVFLRFPQSVRHGEFFISSSWKEIIILIHYVIIAPPPPLCPLQAKTGVVMNIIGIGCISLAINSWGRVMFSLDTFPSWANVTAPV